MRKLYFIIFLLAGGLLSAQSLRKFSREKSAYLQDLRKYLEDNNDGVEKDTLALVVANFDSIFFSFNEAEEKALYEVSDNFIRKRVNDLADWRHFLETLSYFKEELEAGQLATFLEDFKSISLKPARNSRQYLATMHNVFYRNVLFDDGRLRWELWGEKPVYSFKEEPIFTFDVSDLIGYYKSDSTLIEATAGIFKPRKYLFEGQGGIAYFTRAGLSEDSAYVEIDQFNFDVTKPDLQIDSVTLYTNFYLNEPTAGSFHERLTSQSNSSNATFPRFRSYRNDIFIPYILPKAQFTGGFSIIGNRFYGGNNDSSKATISFNYKDTLLLKARSNRFWLRQDKVYSENVEAVIYLKQDSIYHPKLTFRYLPKIDQVSLLRKDEGMGSAIFSDTYHNIDLVFDQINWKVDQPQMIISSNNFGSISPVVVESKNYYREKRFQDLGGMSNRHPLYELQRLSQRMGGRREFSDEDIAYHLKMDKSDAHRFLMRFAILGFIDYNVDTRQAYFKDKIFEYILNARDLRDYDVIQFVSRLEGQANAKLSLEDYAMEIRGIKSIALSDSQRVGLFPYGQKILLKKGLNFDFDGQITAGRFNFWGKNFKFDYDGFRIAMTNVDSMRFKVMSFEPNSLGQKYLVDVKTVLQDLTGDLQIDKPNNKSGRNSYSEYPIFTSGKDSYIYYDKPSIFGGVYNREEFYVRLDPFEIDSLDNISTTGLAFSGTFTSAGIFPEFDEKIKVQPDYSLGFERETPPEGYPAYGGKGNYTASLSLSNEGLRGNGRIDYLNSYALSEEFFFFPDSTDGQTTAYEIDEIKGKAGSNPHVIVDAVQLHWEPKNDVLYTTTLERPFDMYDALGMRTTGTLAHSPNGLKGKGLAEFLDAETRAKDYTFESRRLLSPNTEFRVRANPSADWGFGVKNATAEVDFDEEKGRFSLNDEGAYFELTANKYIAFMDFALWEIPQKAIDLSRKKGLQQSEMISVHPKQDSLRFLASHSKFYLENTLLEAFEVPEILVADAYIYPDTGYVAIDSNAAMRTLNNASISASITNMFHSFYGGVIDIAGANYFKGTADYEYLDQDGTPWPIKFQDIHVDTGTTVGSARISKDEAFYMSPYFAYYGNVKFKADRRDLLFRGYTHIDADCESISTNWFQFESLIDPKNILIELPEVESDDKTKLLANGIYLASDTISGFAAFLSQEVRPTDKQMFFANGVLYYDEDITSYVITERAKVEDPSLPINILRFNNLECTMEGEGEMSLGDGKSQLEVNSYGIIYYDLNTDEMSLDLSLGLDFLINKDLLEQLSKIIAAGAASDGGVDISRPAFQVSTTHRMKAKDRKEFEDDVAKFGAPEKVPDELKQSILFGDITMNWTPESISFLSDGSIGIAGLGESFTNAKVEGFVEIQRKRRGDEVYIYLDLKGEDVYIDYKRNVMGIYTTNEEFMTALREMELKDRRNEKKGLPPFTYTISTKGKMNRFIRRFENFD